MLISDTIRTYVARLLLGILVLMQVNSVVFRHSHRLPNGHIITHAHPYNILGKTCPFSPNPHTSHELLLLDAVSNPMFVPAFALLIAFLLLIAWQATSKFSLPIPSTPAVYQARPTLRGPPCLPSSHR